MAPRWIALALLLPALGAFFMYTFRRDSTQLSPQDLAGRVNASRPEWANYLEDLKAEVGVTPVAEWDGELVRAQRNGRDLNVTFRIGGLWSERDVALPILLRDPFGNIRRNQSATREGDLVDYRFYFPDIESDAPLPWVQIKYPGHERKLGFSEDGRWPAEVEEAPPG